MMVRTYGLHLLPDDDLNIKVVFVALLHGVDPQNYYFLGTREVVDPNLGRGGLT